nr:SDR family NAD(P)-dependent oxidoreductase [Streptomyces sp. NBC_00886]
MAPCGSRQAKHAEDPTDGSSIESPHTSPVRPPPAPRCEQASSPWSASHRERPQWPEADGGAILNMASTAGVMAHAGQAAYSASRHGIIGLTRSAAVEYAKRGIRINAFARPRSRTF